MTALTGAVLAVGPLPVRHRPEAYWPLVSVAVVVFKRFRVRLTFTGNHISLELSGLPMLVGAMVLSPAGALVGVLVGVTAAEIIRRAPLVQACFNVANLAIDAEIAIYILTRILGTGSPVSIRGCLAIAIAMICHELASTLGVVAVTAASGSSVGFGHFKSLGYQLLILSLSNTTLTLAAIAAYLTNPWALIAVFTPCLVVGWWYSSAERLKSRFSDLQSLYALSMSLADLTERNEVLAEALKEIQTVLHCDHAELSLSQPEGLIRYRLGDDEMVIEEMGDPNGVEGAVINTQRPLLLPNSARSPLVVERGWKDVMAVPLTVGGSRSAALVVSDRHGTESVSFSRDDLDFLQALAAHLTTALTSSDHLDGLRRSVAEREHQASHDALTGMANRTLFMNVVASALEQSGGSRMVAVVLMDLDGFKEINDALGHHTGDAVLKVVGSRVSAGVRQVGMAARLGGDEFAFTLPAATTVDEVIEITEQMMETLVLPMDIDNMALTVRASVGIALAPMHGLDAPTLLKNADVAMYTSKRSGRRISVYDSNMDQSSARRLALASDLGRAIEISELELWYQPVADVTSGTIDGFEALLRWPHPTLGYVSPDEFIPIAEQSGLIEPLTWWVAREAFAELRRWRDDGYEFTMAINVSARSLFDSSIVERLRVMIGGTGLSPSHVTLEVTESSMMLEFERSEEVLRRLSDMGVKIAIDDFGTGYSSLSRLKVLPVHQVKIDRSFVKNICSDKGDQAIVRSIIELAQVMGHKVVAEGIEDLPTWSRLAALGCDLGQGHYFARPMPAKACRSWVVERQGPSLAVVRPLGAKRVEGA
ncbi:MAG TPA: EAL domain-containing protein [Acidimicrobiales bacterium]|nr:EAL domain-containing protein [Acidimicrobiales bacterium]